MIEFDHQTFQKSYLLLMTNGQMIFYTDQDEVTKQKETFYFNDQIFNPSLGLDDQLMTILSLNNAIEFVPITDFVFKKKSGFLAINVKRDCVIILQYIGGKSRFEMVRVIRDKKVDYMRILSIQG